MVRQDTQTLNRVIDIHVYIYIYIRSILFSVCVDKMVLCFSDVKSITAKPKFRTFQRMDVVGYC